MNPAITIRFGSDYGSRLRIDEIPDDPDTVCRVETQGFSDIHGAIPGAYRLSEQEHLDLVRELALMLDLDAQEALVNDLEVAIREQRQQRE